MRLELFHYVHCPYCVRVRLALGFLGLPYQSTVLAYDDQTTPVRMTGRKMLPILAINGQPINESLDIIARLDEGNRLRHREETLPGVWQPLEEVLAQLSANVHNLAMPYWVWTPEFNASAREYFMAQKAAKRGPFPALALRRHEFEPLILRDLKAHEARLSPFWDSPSLTIKDLAVAAQVWGLFVLPEFRFPSGWHDYLMRVKEACRFEYHADFWRTL